MSRFALLLTAALAALAAAPAGAAAQPADRLVFPIVFHVATESGEPVVARGDLETWTAEASTRFAPAGIGLAVGEVRHLPEGHAQLETIRDRRILARYLRGRTGRGTERRINIFVVDRIRDPSPSVTTRRAAAMQGRGTTGWLSGAHIRMRGLAPDTYVVMTRRGGAMTVAHELGHFFGAPHHRDPTNIMSYGAERTVFDAHQIRTFRWMARRRARRGEVRTVAPNA